MVDIIDVHDLPDKDIKLVKRLVDYLRKKGEINKTKKKEKIDFASWPLGVKGKLTRDEIYDHL